MQLTMGCLTEWIKMEILRLHWSHNIYWLKFLMYVILLVSWFFFFLFRSLFRFWGSPWFFDQASRYQQRQNRRVRTVTRGSCCCLLGHQWKIFSTHCSTSPRKHLHITPRHCQVNLWKIVYPQLYTCLFV